MRTNITNWTSLKPRLRFVTGQDDAPGSGGATDDPKDDDNKDDVLGEPGKRALEAERKARREAEQKLRKFQEAEDERKRKEMSEVDRLKAEKEDAERRAKEREVENLRYRVATSLEGFPPAMIDRLRGETEEEIKRDAEELLRLVPGTDSRRGPRGDRSQGPKDKTSAPSKQEQFAETIEDLFNR